MYVLAWRTGTPFVLHLNINVHIGKQQVEVRTGGVEREITIVEQDLLRVSFISFGYFNFVRTLQL